MKATAAPDPPLRSLGALVELVRESNVTEAVVVGSSPRAPDQLAEYVRDAERPALYVGLNAAVRLVADQVPHGPPGCVWSVMCDWRAAVGLGPELRAALTPSVTRVWSGNVKASNNVGAGSPLVPIRYLGDVGFSWDAEIGIYSGYTVAYVAAQLLVFAAVERVQLIGVDLDYGSGRPRFYGGAAAKTDQHALGRQIVNMRRAVANMRSVGIEVITAHPSPAWLVT